MIIQKAEIPEIVQRKLSIQPGTVNADMRMVDVVLATGATIQTFSLAEWKPINERLSMDPSHVRQERMARGLPLLNAHKRDDLEDQIGKVINLRFEDGQLVGTLLFSKRESVAAIFQDVQDGIYDSVSVGYRVYVYEVTKREGQMDDYLAVDWEPMEGSMVPVPADAKCATRSCDLRTHGENAVQEPTTLVIEEERAMTGEKTIEVDVGLKREDFDVLLRHAVTLGLGADVVQSVSAEKHTLGEAMLALGEAQARKLRDAAAVEKVTPAAQAQVMVTRAEQEKDAEAIIEYLQYRGAPRLNKMTERAQKFIGHSMVDLCRHALSTNGVNPMGRSKQEIVRMALGQAISKRDIGGMHTTSDFPDLLGEITNRSLLKAYMATPDDYSQFVTETTFSDPRTRTFIRVGGLGVLRDVGEGQEYKRVSFGDRAEEVSIEKHGEIFSLSYEAILRDDLSAFTRLPDAFGSAAKLTEANMVFGLLVANPVMSDTVALFDAAHGNVGTADSPDVSGITDARTLMRAQTDPDSGARLGIKPALIISPYKFENGLSQIMADATLVPAVSTNVVPGYIRDMKYVISDVLDANSTQKWYAVADPARIEGIVVARLEGNRPFELERKEGWNVDGIEWKVRHWFGVGVVDHRGLYYNAGE